MRNLRRRIAAGGVVVGLLAPFAGFAPPAQGAADGPAGSGGPSCAAAVIDAPRSGATGSGAVAALRAAGALAAAAQAAEQPVAAYERMLRRDATMRVDDCGRTFAVDPAPATAPAAAQTDANPPLDNTGDPFALESRPGAALTIYLDFRGRRIVDTQWNQYTSNPDFVAPAYDTDGDPAAFGTTEQGVVRETWIRVAEDFAPFGVNVTTRDPGDAAIDRSGVGDLVYGSRVLITNDTVVNDACGGCGGIAYVGVFDAPASHEWYQPAFVFPARLGSAKNIAEAASHEAGHHLALNHDGASGTEYYSGRGVWAPVMGTAYSRAVSHWSRGEYAGATNLEDDLAILDAQLGTAADDHGDTRDAATFLGPGAPGIGAMIETRADVDVFRFVAGGGVQVAARVTPQAVGGNLDVDLTLYDAAGSVVARVNPAVGGTVTAPTGLDASLTQTLPAGTYFLAVDGSGEGDPTSTGYSDYDSVGRYAIQVTGTLTRLVAGAEPAPRGVVGAAYSAAWTAAGGMAPYTWSVVAGSLPSGTTLSADGTLTGVPDSAQTVTATLQAADSAAGTARQTVTHPVTFVIDPALALTTAEALPAATVGAPYGQALQAFGGGGGYTFTVAGGALPAGLTLTGGGQVSGTPTSAGTATFTAQVTDAYGRSASRTFTLAVADPVSVAPTPPPTADSPTTLTTPAPPTVVDPEPAPLGPGTAPQRPPGGLPFTGTLVQAVASLPVAAGRSSGYAAGKFPIGDRDRDCQRTRTEVLIARSTSKVTFTGPRRCEVRGGRWFSYFDREYRRRASAVTVVATVTPREAWLSGAFRWSKARRAAFINDLDDRWMFTVVTDAAARARGDRDPARWLPEARSRCQYVAEWTAVKLRWGLRVDAREKAILGGIARSCSRQTVLPVS